MKKNLVLLACLIGWCVCGMEATYRMGVGAMLKMGGETDGVWGAEYGIGVLRRHGGADGEAMALKLATKLLSSELEGDLLDGLRETVCGGMTTVLDRLEGPQGGWAAERGGQPELWGTLVALECLLELDNPPAASGRGWKWLVERIMESGELSCCGFGGDDWRVAGQLLTVGGLARRHGWGLDAASRRILGRTMAVVIETIAPERLEESGKGIGIYDSALLLRGLCLLGMFSEGEAFARRLMDAQLADGGWEDATAGDDWLVTCAAVEALGCYLAAKRQEGGLAVDFLTTEGEETGRFGAREYVQLALDGVVDGTVVTLEILKDSEIMDFRYIGEPDGCVCSWFTGTCEPGCYELRIVFWDGDGLSWLGEERLDFEIVADAECHGLSWEEPLRDCVLHGGDEWCTSFCMAWDYDGNTAEVGTLLWELAWDGAIMDSGEVSVELTPRKRRMRVVLSERPCVAPSVPGVYELTGRLVTSSGEYACCRRLTVVSGAVYVVENDVSPRQITLGASRLRHTLRVRCIEGETICTLAGFTVATEDRRIIDEPGRRLVVELTDIHGEDGLKMESGWLAVQSHYGRCEGDMDLGTQRKEGFVCGVSVVDGAASFTIEASGGDRAGTMAVTVYQLDMEDIAIGEKLGQFEIYWLERK